MSKAFTCDVCGEEFDIEDIGYMGPSDRDSTEECSDMMDFVTLCKACELKTNVVLE